MNKIPVKFIHFLKAPISCQDTDLVELYVQQVYIERIENILNRKEEITDADLMLIIADIAAEAPLDSDYTAIFEYIGNKETRHPFKELSSATKELYKRSKRDLFSNFVKSGKKRPSENIYTFAGQVILTMPEEFVKKVTVPLLMIIIVRLAEVIQKHELPEYVVQSLKNEIEDYKMFPKNFPYSLHDVIDTVVNSMETFINKEADYEK